MGSSRFPGKPLARILDLPMIEHVYRRTASCDQLQEVFVATCDAEIKSVVEEFGGRVIMTSSSHERATDRVAEAAEHVEADIVVMVQGDEPMITAGMIEASLEPLISDGSVDCVNLIRQITSKAEYLDPNTIKVVADACGNALYFSRAPIPGGEFTDDIVAFKQVCVIPFRRSLLREFARLSQTPLERSESIDMLRLIENGYRVRLVETDVVSHAVDTPEDLQLLEELMKNR